MRRLLILVALLAGLSAIRPAQAAPALSLQDSFRIGTTGVLCTAQRLSEDAAYRSAFDRAYDIVCRDASSPVGKLYALDAGQGRTLPGAAETGCEGESVTAQPAIGSVRRRQCRSDADGLAVVRLSVTRGRTLYVARGFTAYESALRLGLAAIVRDRIVPGAIDVASTGATDAAALTRLQAGRLDADQALAAAYKLANTGGFADASDYFEDLVGRARSSPEAAQRLGEYLANQAMEQSTLGNPGDAERLFAQAEALGTPPGGNAARLLRNLKAMHRLNQQDGRGALAILDAPLKDGGADAAFPLDRIAEGYVDRPLSQQLGLDDDRSTRFLGASQRLTDGERQTLLDAQTSYLRAVAWRMNGDDPAAARLLEQSWSQYLSVRAGRVRSMAWLAAGIATERATLADQRKDSAAAEAQLRQAAAIMATNYPDTASLLAARARLAAYEARHGGINQAIASFRAITAAAPAISGGGEALRTHIEAYLDALVARGGDPAAQADFFAATQVLVRPGVAQTQAVLARELSGGSTDAARLFRQSINLSREVVQLDTQIAWLSGQDRRTPVEEATLAAARERRRQLTASQTETIARLSAFPKFRVVDNEVLTLADLQHALKPDEAYFKLVLVDQAAFAMLIGPDRTTIYRIGRTAAELETLSDTIRDSIVTSTGNQLVTNPFDVAAARTLFLGLMGPAADRLATVHHLIFEPDGPLLKLPATILVTDQAGVDAYAERQKHADADPFDMRGIAWLGRDRIVSTAVSPRAFMDVRAIAPSRAPRRFLGLGQNAPIDTATAVSANAGAAADDGCGWPPATWNHPVSGAELAIGDRILGGTGNRVVTGAAFTDAMVRQSGDLADYRVVQFATHGLVTAPHPGCPARPALVTSFAAKDSDGLLSFREIFDLRLDADTVLLSACDTAGAATAAATREAGIATGGNFALDGLVRAFVGAGARTVVASHWPVPDDFNATGRLMTGLYQGSTDMALGEALRRSQRALMDDPVTSHPYYWAAFVILGDASKPMTTR